MRFVILSIATALFVSSGLAAEGPAMSGYPDLAHSFEALDGAASR